MRVFGGSRRARLRPKKGPSKDDLYQALKAAKAKTARLEAEKHSALKRAGTLSQELRAEQAKTALQRTREFLSKKLKNSLGRFSRKTA